MSLNRRNTLKLLLAASVGAPAAGYWSLGYGEITSLLDRSPFNNEQQNLLTGIVDTIIPKTSSWGAVELGVPIYLLAYLNQCVEPDVQNNVKTQLSQLEKYAKKEQTKPFLKCTQAAREQVLLIFSNSKQAPETEFFNLVKKHTVHGFLTSKEVKTGPYHYRIAPGHFKGCVDVQANSVT